MYRAAGDGKTDDTIALQQAMEFTADESFGLVAAERMADNLLKRSGNTANPRSR